MSMKFKFFGSKISIWASQSSDEKGAAESNVCCLPTVYPSVLYQTAIWPMDWTQGHVIGWCEKNGGRLGQCLWGKVRGYGPLTTHVKAWLTHTLHHLNEKVCSLLSAICPHLHIRQRAKWPNAGFDAKQTQCFAGIIPSSDPASAFVRRLKKYDWLCFTFYAHIVSRKIWNSSKT